MTKIIRTDSDNDDFVTLVRFLDADLATKDGDEHSFYNQFNKIDKIKCVIVAYDDALPVGCGAIKEYSQDAMEIKRMFVSSEHRGKGLGTKILTALENWAKELCYKKCVLETGRRQPDAISLYKKNGYNLIPNYGQYLGIENSVCFEKGIF